MLDVLVSIILFHDAKEDKLIQEFDHLSENVRTFVHVGRISSAKLSSNRCALKNLATYYLTIFSKSYYVFSADSNEIIKYITNGVAGFLFTSRFTSKSIFIPAAGFYDDENLIGKGKLCYIWTSQVDFDGNNIIVLEHDRLSKWGAVRCYGIPVRPVRDI